MAQRVQVELIDDVDGSTATTTVQFTVDGKSWQLDLSEKNAAAFRADMSRWSQHARRVGVNHGSHRRPARRDPAQAAQIRTWARNNGFDVGPRSPISVEVADAYEAAHRGN